MKYTREELLEALRIIKDECDMYDRDKCELCPFYQTGGCGINANEPWMWDFNDEEPTWRAFL